jgi:hypothetical protein|tara:strand:+ start:906 stop:1103 length:198 start_codon:yes stop_codon:yes gene_type:complete
MTNFNNWNCDDLTTPQKAEIEAKLELEAKKYASMMQESNNSRSNLDDVNDALMENPLLWDNLENL